MNLSEKLQKDMAGLKAHHQRIEALADSSLQKLGFVGARAVNTVYSHGNQSLAVTYYADSELNISEGESMGLRVAFEVCTAADAKIKVLAFFRAKPTLDLVSLRVVECEGVDNPDHRAILESQLRSANTDDRLRQGKPENALAQFVKNASSTLARIHFRP